MAQTPASAGTQQGDRIKVDAALPYTPSLIQIRVADYLQVFAFAHTSTTHKARQVLRISLVFLPALFILLVLEVVLKRTISF